jgi:hypothetical protein
VHKVWKVFLNFNIPLLTQCGPYCLLVAIVSNRVILFLNDIYKILPSGFGLKISILLYGIFLIVILPPNFDIGDNLMEKKGDIFPIRKTMDREIKM